MLFLGRWGSLISPASAYETVLYHDARGMAGYERGCSGALPSSKTLPV